MRGFLKLADGVSKGNTLAETMAENPDVFAPLDVMLIEAAETSGSLGELLTLLSGWHEFCRRLSRKILSGLALPVVLIHLTAIFAPLPGFFLGGWNVASYLIQAIGILLLFYVPAGVTIIIIRMTPKTGPLREALDRFTLKIPVFGKAIYKFALSRYCWVFHMLLKAGVPIVDCAEKAASTAGNAVVAEKVKPAAASAKLGHLVSEGFSSNLPMGFLDIWRVGEETGELDNVTKRLADSYGEDADFLFSQFGQWLPRFVYFLVSLLIIYYIIRNSAMV
ncbi:MAG: type II secretion system F family protein, partial [Planctomycetota bacterium]